MWKWQSLNGSLPFPVSPHINQRAIAWHSPNAERPKSAVTNAAYMGSNNGYTLHPSGAFDTCPEGLEE